MARPGLLPVLLSRKRTLLTDPAIVALWRAKHYSGSGDLLDLTGRGRNAQLGSAAGSDTNDPLFLAHSGQTYVWFPGTSGNNLSVPNPVASADYTVTYEDSTTQTRTAATANPLVFGQADADFADRKVTQIEVRNTAGQAVVANFVAASATAPFATFVDSLGNTWTFNRTTGRKLAVVDRPLFVLGTDDYFQIAAHADLNFGSTDNFTIACVVRHFGALVSSQRLISKSTSPGWMLYSTSSWRQFVRDGAVTADDQGPSSSAGQITTTVGRLSRPTVECLVNGTTNGATDAASVGSMSNANVVRIGADGGGTPANFADIEFIAAAVFRRALSNSEIVQLERELLQ